MLNQLTKVKSTRRAKPAVKFLFSSKHNLLLIFLLITLGLQVLIFLQILALNLLSMKVANRPVPSLVQLSDGNTVLTSPVDTLERTPVVIKKFVTDTILLLFNWTGQLPPVSDSPERLTPKDPGISLVQGKITTAAYEASFALATDFRNQFLETLAEMIPDGVFSGSTQSVVLLSHISEPQLVSPGAWKVEIVASLMLFSQTQQLGEAIPLNKEIFVRAVVPEVQPQENTTPLQKLVYRVRSAGLEIYLIRDLQVN
jgi:hypothetical protein